MKRTAEPIDFDLDGLLWGYVLRRLFDEMLFPFMQNVSVLVSHNVLIASYYCLHSLEYIMAYFSLQAYYREHKKIKILNSRLIVKLAWKLHDYFHFKTYDLITRTKLLYIKGGWATYGFMRKENESWKIDRHIVHTEDSFLLRTKPITHDYDKTES